MNWYAVAYFLLAIVFILISIVERDNTPRVGIYCFFSGISATMCVLLFAGILK